MYAEQKCLAIQSSQQHNCNKITAYTTELFSPEQTHRQISDRNKP